MIGLAPSALTAAASRRAIAGPHPRHGDLVRLGASFNQRAGLATINRAEHPLLRRAAARRWRGLMLRVIGTLTLRPGRARTAPPPHISTRRASDPC